VSPKWKKAMEGFFHGQLGQGSACSSALGLPADCG
jgi:hypothetical protein